MLRNQTPGIHGGVEFYTWAIQTTIPVILLGNVTKWEGLWLVEFYTLKLTPRDTDTMLW